MPSIVSQSKKISPSLPIETIVLKHIKYLSYLEYFWIFDKFDMWHYLSLLA